MNRDPKTSRRAGAAFERVVADGFASSLDDDRIDRRVKYGAKDRGDIGGIRTPHGSLVVEVKNTARLDLAGFTREAQTEAGNADAVAGVVVLKRRGRAAFEDQYVLMTVREMLAIVWGITTEPRP